MQTVRIDLVAIPIHMNKEVMKYMTEDKLYESMMKCKKCVLWKDSVAHFYLNWNTEINKLMSEIKNGTYKQRKPYHFYVGKRKIMSISFRDRIVERIFDDEVIYPSVEKSLIKENMACQKGKGTECARDCLKRYIRREWINHGNNIYALKCDIKGYYDNIAHEVGESEIAWYTNKECFDFVKENILSAYVGDKGYIAGNQTVQIIGITTLSQIDHYIKEKLRVKGYVRYMDDFILLSSDRNFLEHCKHEIEKELSAKGLFLNQKKTKIINLSNDSVEFLGFDFSITQSGKVLCFVSSKKAKRKRIELKRMAHKVIRGEMDRENADRSYNDYRVHCMYGDSRNFLVRLDNYYYGLYGEEVPRDVNYKKKSKTRKRDAGFTCRESNIKETK